MVAYSFLNLTLSLSPNLIVEGNTLVFPKMLTVHWMDISHEAQFLKPLEPNSIVLWEDIWYQKPMLVQSRIKSLLGNNQKVLARNSKTVHINKPILDDFMSENHLMGSSTSKYKLGLTYKGVLVAAASFSTAKTFRRDNVPFQSVELIRYANLSGVNVVGGFSKILQRFIRQYRPDDIMTYADREWSDGNMYEKLGFQLVEHTEPQSFWIHSQELIRYYPHRLPAELVTEKVEQQNDFLVSKGYCKIYNMGNLKYLLKLK